MLSLLVICVFIGAAGAECIIAGDPFYTTFDGAVLEFQGKCHYNLASFEDPDDDELFTKFAVYAQNQVAPQDSTRSFTHKTHIDIVNHRISLHDSGVVYVDDEDLTSKIKANATTGYAIDSAKTVKVYVDLATNLVTVVAENVITVTWDARGPSGRHVAKITVNNAGYAGQLTGICGNNNGDEQDDHYPKGLSNAGSDTEVGNSWIINGQQCL